MPFPALRPAPLCPRLALVLGLLAPGQALAASCQSLARSANSVSAEQLGPTYARLVRCDQKLAEESFDDFMRASKTLDTLTAVSLAAIDSKLHAPVYPMLEKVPDLSLRDEVARAVGEECADHPEVAGFLKGAYTALHDRQFGMWGAAFRVCQSDELDQWLVEVTLNPPSVSYDEKYNVVTEALVKRQRAAALPALEKAAVAAAAHGGPFSTLLDRMGDAVKPDTFGADIPAEDREKLESTLVAVARHVDADLARQVADRLYQAGAEAAAASLLPAIYPDRVRGKGTLVYGVASVESCDDQAVVHYAEVTEPGSRWSIVDDVTPIALGFKARLKCEAEGDWPVLTTPEPLVKGGLEDWVGGIEKEWASKGLDVKLRAEKAIALE